MGIYLNSNYIELLLCIFLGVLGAHKFYIKNWKCGLFFLFTAGFAFLGVCIDIFLILFFWRIQDLYTLEEISQDQKSLKNRQKLLYNSANDSFINYKYINHKGKAACAAASGFCLWLMLVFIVLVTLFFTWPFISNDYYHEIYSSMKYEREYNDINKTCILATKEYNIENKDRSKKFKKIKLFYPKILEDLKFSNEINDYERTEFPVIVISNPVGVPYSKYQSVFNHLASYGFVVVGNDDLSANDETLTGVIDYLHYLNHEDEKFKNKFNLNLIGLVGYYQGSLPVINLLNTLPYNNSIGATYVTCIQDYDVTSESSILEKIRQIYSPYFQTGPEKNYDRIMGKVFDSFPAENKEIVSAIRKKKYEGEMIIYGDAYMTAWFTYQLKHNFTLVEVFSKDSNSELNKNGNWTSRSRIEVMNISYYN